MKEYINKIFCCFCCQKKERLTEVTEEDDPNYGKNENKVNSTTDTNLILDDEKDRQNEKEKKEEKTEENLQKNINTNFNNYGINMSMNDISDDELILSKDSPLLNEFEKGITFSKKGLSEEFDKLWNLEGYFKLYDKENIICEIRNEGSSYTNEFCLVKLVVKQNKSELGEKENTELSALIDFFYNPKIRLMWDTPVLSIDRLTGNDNFFVINTKVKPPVFFMSDRDAVEKKLVFNYNNEEFAMSSSVPDNLFPKVENVVRIFNYANHFKIVDEGENIAYYSISQTDFKMVIPQMLVNMALPSSTKNWFGSVKDFANKVTYDKNTRTVKEKNSS